MGHSGSGHSLRGGGLVGLKPGSREQHNTAEQQITNTESSGRKSSSKTPQVESTVRGYEQKQRDKRDMKGEKRGRKTNAAEAAGPNSLRLECISIS